MKKLILSILAFSLATTALPQQVKEIEILPNETQNFNNQTTPLLISNKGRYIWCDGPFQFQLRDGKIRIESARGTIEYATAGNTLKEAYLTASGKYLPPAGILPPELFFSKPQYNTWIELIYNQNQEDILKYARSIIDNGFPTGILMIDDNWQKDYGNFNFRPDKFPNPKAMVDELHAMGFKVMLWVSPFVSPDSEEFRYLKTKGYLVKRKGSDQPAILDWWNGSSACYDLSNPEAYNHLRSTLKKMQQDYHIDGFKFDAGDPERYPEKEVDVFDRQSYDTEQTYLWAKLGLEFPYNEFRACWKLGGQPLVQRLGDKKYSWDGVASLVPSMIAAGLLGYSYACPDMIGGGEYSSFQGIDASGFDQTLIVRSCQIHSMMPMMQLDYAFPNQGFEECRDQYMLGDKYLVAPIMSSGNTRTVKLPKGKWKDDLGKVYKGGKTYTLDVPLSRLPWFVEVK